MRSSIKIQNLAGVMSMARKFSFGATRLMRTPSETRAFDEVDTLDGLFVTSSRVEPNEPISVVGIAESVHEGILVKAKLNTRWHGECVRCLGEASGEIDVSVIELFEQGADPEGETYHFDGDVIDMAEMIRDNVVLELPIAPLCSVNCKGLCQYCGADLNLGRCECDMAPKDPRWQTLETLRHEGSESAGNAD